MEKTFYFQPHLRYCELPMRWFMGLLVAGMLAIAVAAGVPLNSGQPLVRMALYFSATILLIAALGHVVCRRWRDARFVVTDERLIQYDLFSVKVLSFTNVRSLYHVHFLYWIGVAILRSDTTVLFLPFVVDDMAGLGAAVAERLTACGKADLCNTSRFARFLRAARINDIVNDRIYRDMGTLSRMVFAATFFSALVALRVWRFPVAVALLWALCGFIFPLVSYLTANIIIARGVAAYVDTHSAGRPGIDTGGIHWKLGLTAGVLYLCTGIAFRWFWTAFFSF